MAEKAYSTPLKRCSVCLEEKPATAEFFHPNKGGKYGLRSQCRPCRKAAAREQIKRPENAARRKIAQAEYVKSGKSAERGRKWLQRRRESGPRCSIDGCERHLVASGLCAAHYRRNAKYDSPLAGRTAPGDPVVFLADVSSRSGEADCIIWPYARTGGGYGNVWFDGKFHVVSRLVCEMAHGPAPSDAHEAAHDCGNGHLGCCNPEHLRWDTAKGNAADRLVHRTHTQGERHPTAKLTEENVREIIALWPTLSQAELGRRYGVTQQAIHRVLRGKTWRYMMGSQPPALTGIGG